MTQSPPLRLTRAQERWAATLSYGLLAVLAAAILVAWSPRYWPVTVLDAGIFAVAIAWLLRNLALDTPLVWTPLFVPVCVMGTWGAVQLLLGSTAYRFATERSLLYWLGNAVALLLAAQLLQPRRARRDFLAALAFLSVFVAVIGILQYLTSPDKIYWLFPVAQRTRAVGPFVYRNQFAALVELVLPICLYRTMTDRAKRWLFALLSAILIAVVVATASRAGTILVGIEMLLIFLLGWRRRMLSTKSLLLVLGQVVVLIAVLTLVVGFQDVWTRFQQTNPYALRGKLAESTIRMFQARPVMGYGLGTWQTVYPSYATFDNSLFANEAHNDWAQWTAEGGIFFGLAIAAVAIGAALLGWRTIWGLGVAFVFLHSFIDYPTREPAIGAVLFVLIGAMVAADRESEARHHMEVEEG